MEKIDVLDHGLVRLVDYMGSDLSIIRAARVSYNAAPRSGQNKGSDSALLRRLITHNHSTPFEAVTLTFEVKAPIFVVRQWHRHRTWSYNELSARYKELPEEFYVPSGDVIGEQSTHDNQMRDMTSTSKDVQSVMIMEACAASFRVYHELLKREVPRELARGVLPMNTYTHMFATVNLLNLLKFLKLRLDEHAQYEIRQYAEAMNQLAEKVAPETMRIWREVNL